MELVFQESDVTHGPLVLYWHLWFSANIALEQKIKKCRKTLTLRCKAQVSYKFKYNQDRFYTCMIPSLNDFWIWPGNVSIWVKYSQEEQKQHTRKQTNTILAWYSHIVRIINNRHILDAFINPEKILINNLLNFDVINLHVGYSNEIFYNFFSILRTFSDLDFIWPVL